MISDSYFYTAYSEMNESLFGVTVKSSGHIFAKKGRIISRPHGRDDWLLFYVAKGTEHFYLDAEVDANEGSFVFFKPYEPQKHSYLHEQTGEFYYIHFTAPENFNLFGFSSSTVYHAPPSSHVKELFEEMIYELNTKHPCYEKICISLLLSIICRLERKCRSIGEKENKHAGEIASAIQLMNKEYAKNYSLAEYAEMFHMSKFHFLRTFKDITGHSPLEYRAKIRIEHAAELLSDSDMPIVEIAYLLGFSSQAYFCDAFKKCYGEPPTSYRKSNRKRNGGEEHNA